MVNDVLDKELFIRIQFIVVIDLFLMVNTSIERNLFGTFIYQIFGNSVCVIL